MEEGKKKDTILSLMHLGYKVIEDIYSLMNISLPEKIEKN